MRKGQVAQMMAKVDGFNHSAPGGEHHDVGALLHVLKQTKEQIQTDTTKVRSERATVTQKRTSRPCWYSKNEFDCLRETAPPDVTLCLFFEDGNEPEKLQDAFGAMALVLALLVKPANSLSFQAWLNQGLDEASANFLNCQLGPAM